MERLEPEKVRFAKLDRFCPPHAILTASPSTLGRYTYRFGHAVKRGH